MADWKPPKFGTPVWMGIAAHDVERAHKFYSTVFDWKFKDHKDLEENPPEKLRMMEFRPDIELSGGIQKVPEPTGIMKPGGSGVIVYYLVEDVEKIGPVIEEAGGKMLSDAQKEGKSGLYRFFQDTEGTVGGVYQVVM